MEIFYILMILSGTRNLDRRNFVVCLEMVSPSTVIRIVGMVNRIESENDIAYYSVIGY